MAILINQPSGSHGQVAKFRKSPKARGLGVASQGFGWARSWHVCFSFSPQNTNDPVLEIWKGPWPQNHRECVPSSVGERHSAQSQPSLSCLKEPAIPHMKGDVVSE